jgi:hypothetical protein
VCYWVILKLVKRSHKERNSRVRELARNFIATC